MIKQIFKGYLRLLKLFLIIVCSLAVCAIVSYAFIWPLWFTATTFPTVYTTIIIFLLVALFLLFLIRKFVLLVKSNKTKDEKSLLIKKTILKTMKFLIPIIGILIALLFVLSYNRIGALITLLVCFLFYGFIIFGYGKNLEK